VSIGRLVVFAKVPQPGRVKTRLSPGLDPDQAARLYGAMLQDVLEASARWARELDLEAVLAFDPPDGHSAMRRLAPASYHLEAQRGEGLGLRMANAFADSVSRGMSFTVLRGSDSPLLERAHVLRTVESLQEGADLVLTPDQGGGYAMIGGRNPAQELFEVPMSTREVLGNTIARAEARGMDCVLTPMARDVDVLEDLDAFNDLSSARSSDLCPRTVQCLGHLRAQGVL